MKEEGRNIFSVFDELIPRDEKEKRLNQKAKVIWLTGLSGSGKTTIAKHLEQRLFSEGYLCQVLDGDNIRSGINSNLSFSSADRTENIRRIAEVSKLFLDCGIICINCFVSPVNELRNLARNIIGSDDFIEVFIDTSVETCEERDTKGLYKKARAGEIKDFTGINAPFEKPENPAITIQTEGKTIAESSKDLYDYLKNKIELNRV